MRCLIIIKKNLFITLSFLLYLAPSLGWAYQIGEADIELRAGVIEAYDDNITFAGSNKKSGSNTSLNLGLDGKYEGKNRGLSFSADINHKFFNSYSNFDNTSENVSITFQQELSVYQRVSLRESFTHSEEPKSFEDEFGRNTGRYSYYVNNVSCDYAADISKQLSLIFHYANEIYDPNRADLSQSFQNSLGAQAEYAINSQSTGYITYDFTRRDFNPGTKVTFNTLGGGWRQYFTSQFYADSRAGIDFINSFSGRNYAKPFYQFSLGDQFDEQSRLTFSLSKEYTVNAYTEDIFNQWRSSIAFSKQILARLSSSLSVFYGEGEYTNQGIKDEFSGSSIGLNYELWHNTRFNAGYSYSKTDSNLDGRGYTRNYISAGLMMGF